MGLPHIRALSDAQILWLMRDTEHTSSEHLSVLAVMAADSIQQTWPPFIAAQVAHDRGVITTDEYGSRTWQP